MILRIWHGWTTPEDADAYERLLTEEIFPDIEAEMGEGLRGYEVGRRENGGGEVEGDGEVEFVTIMRFESADAVETLVGEDYEQAHIPDAAREVLTRWDERVKHFEVRVEESV